ncbi:MAG: hypothetical protein ACI9U2_003464 [Bradymonadia bacterium]|jgi:hypothetical protein
MIERLIVLALSLAAQSAIADDPPPPRDDRPQQVDHSPKGSAMDKPKPHTASMAQLAAEQAGSFAEQLEAIRVTQDAHARVTLELKARETFKAESDAEGYALTLMAWATSAEADRRDVAVRVLRQLRNGNLVAMLIARAKRPAVSAHALASLAALAGPKATDAASWHTWHQAGGRPW